MKWNVGEKLSFFGKQIIAFRRNLYPTNLIEYNRIKEKGLRGGDPRRNLIIFYQCWERKNCACKNFSILVERMILKTFFKNYSKYSKSVFESLFFPRRRIEGNDNFSLPSQIWAVKTFVANFFDENLRFNNNYHC